MASPAPEPVAILNGRVIPLREACLSVVDDGFVQGATVTERLRTFAHRPYLLSEHLERLRSSLEQTGIAPASFVDSLPSDVEIVVKHNARLISDWQDLAVVIAMTPGLNPAMSKRFAGERTPTVCVHTTPLPPAAWATLATNGVNLITPTVRQVSPTSLAPQIKHRSRLHWFLAEREVRQSDPHAAALLLDEDGHVTETSTGNLMAFDGKRLLTPRPQMILRGISQQVVTNLAADCGIETVAVDLTPQAVAASEEAFLVSTGYCLLSVVSLNGNSIGTGQPGPLAGRLLNDWSTAVGVNITEQHQRAVEHESK